MKLTGWVYEGVFSMNDKFFQLSEEKQLRIVNAAMEVFGKHDYRHAVTDDIAAKAGISKGLLFHYFENKKGLYMYLYYYCLDMMKQMILKQDFLEIDDFFEIMEYGANKKVEMIKKNPYIMEFSIRAFYSEKEAVSEEIHIDIQQQLASSFSLYFSHIDFTKFRDDVDPVYVYQMLQWMVDGYMHSQQCMQVPLDIDALMTEFHRWVKMLRPMVYKKEYQEISE